ncbi:MAG: PHP domain-containing protein [Burkholderiales bacterium]
MRIDLHTHSVYSDGMLTPAALIERAVLREVSTLALTDHDEMGGLGEACLAARDRGVRLISGVEISVSWRSQTIHVVGLDLDPAHVPLAQGLAGLRDGRRLRALKISEQLETAGLLDPADNLVSDSVHRGALGRGHFARALAASGRAKNPADAFKRFLAQGKAGYVDHVWAELGQAVAWIRGAGGFAILAHPERYRISRPVAKALWDEFKHCGGHAIEICRDDPGVAAEQIRSARCLGFMLSGGSDFHGPGAGSADLGDVASIDSDPAAVWLHEDFGRHCH